MTRAHFRDSCISINPPALQHQYAALLLAIKISISKPRPLLLQVAHLFVILDHAVTVWILQPPCHKKSLSLIFEDWRSFQLQLSVILRFLANREDSSCPGSEMCRWETRCTILINNFYCTVFCLLCMFRKNLVVHHQQHCIIYCIAQYNQYNSAIRRV